MSEKEKVLFDLVRAEALDAQRVCAWCGLECKSADALVIHILHRHAEDSAAIAANRAGSEYPVTK